LPFAAFSTGSSAGSVLVEEGDCCVDRAACRLNALSRVATTLSTRRNRLRCRSFWGEDMRHGIFLRPCQDLSQDWNYATYHNRPPDKGAEGLNAPNILKFVMINAMVLPTRSRPSRSSPRESLARCMQLTSCSPLLKLYHFQLLTFIVGVLLLKREDSLPVPYRTSSVESKQECHTTSASSAHATTLSSTSTSAPPKEAMMALHGSATKRDT